MPTAVPLARLAAVAAALLATFVVRTWGLPDGGLLYYDEGWAGRDGRFVLGLLASPHSWPGLIHAVFTADWGDWKPGHDLLLGGLLALGVSPDDLPWYSATAGLVMMAALSVIAWRRWGPPAAAVAAVFAGSLPLGIIYGRHVLSEADGLATLAAAVLLWDLAWERPGSRRRTLAALAALALTVTVNYRLIPVIIPLVAALAWRHLRPAAVPSAWGRRIVVLTLLPALAIVAVYATIAVLARLLGITELSGVLVRVIRSGPALPSLFQFPDFYFRVMWDYAGPVFAVVFGLGLLSVAVRRQADGYLLAAAGGTVVGTLLFFTAVHDKAPRAVAVLIPFVALLAARGITLWTRPGRQWAVAAAACVLLLAGGWVGSGEARQAGGIGAAGRWLAPTSGGIAADRNATITVYVRENRRGSRRGWDRLVVQPHAGTLAALRQEAVRWVVVDANTWILGSALTERLSGCAHPVAEFADPASWTRIWFLDGADTVHRGYDGTLALKEEFLHAGARPTVAIYDLEDPSTAACA